ncbi:MAG: hypothetical protein K8953_09495 [Proteobacteria bacterium]|nr:hypothetical protein [Pseudomonadota bacterium]
MINKTIKTLACLLAGLTLTACVGAVTVPTDTEKTTERETRAIDPVPSAPQIDVGRGYYIGTLTSNQSNFRNVKNFRIDVDFDNRTLTGGESVKQPARSQIIDRGAPFATTADRNFACLVQRNTDSRTYTDSRGRCITPSRPAYDYNLEVSGTFTPRGVISGTVDYEACTPTCPRFPDRSNLTGTVSKQRIIGRFSGDFTGGFTVNRR